MKDSYKSLKLYYWCLQRLKNHHESFPAAAWRAISKGSCTPFIKNSVISLQMRRHDSNGDKQTYHPAQKNPIGQPMISNSTIHKIVQRTLILLCWWLLPKNWLLYKKRNKSYYTGYGRGQCLKMPLPAFSGFLVLVVANVTFHWAIVGSLTSQTLWKC
jgi:hypothetical protein